MRPAALCLSQPVDKGASGVGGRFFPARLRAVLWVVERPDRRGERSRGRRHATGAGADSGRDGGELADLCRAGRAAPRQLCRACGPSNHRAADRKSVVEGKSVPVRGERGGRLTIKKKKKR